MSHSDQQVVPGISISAAGQATVDQSMTEVLFELALQLEAPSGHPVDVQHVLAAIVMAARRGELDPAARLSADNPSLVLLLVPHVKTVFAQYGGAVGQDD
jgi:hypothetical protein